MSSFKTRRLSPRFSRRTNGGFSLIELLVVSAILTIVMTAVFGTVTVATRTTRQNSGLTEANQNLRAATRLITNDITTVGENFSTPAQFASVRAGFFAAHGFPTADINNVAGFDRMYAVQAWTLASTNGSASVSTLSTLAVKGVTNTGGTPISTVYSPSVLSIYPGSCGPDRVAAGPLGGSLYNTGTDQLMLAQVDPLFVNLNVPLVPGPGTTQQIFPLTNDYRARATFSGGNLVLVPNTNVVGLIGPRNFDPTALVTGATFVNTNDSLLANRLQPFVDCLLIVNGTSQFLGLVTAVDTANGNISLSTTDPIGLNPVWNTAIPGMTAIAGPDVLITRVRLTYYFVGWTGAADAANGTPPILYRREGALINPVAFNIENFQLRFDLIDEFDQGLGSGRFWTVENLGQMPAGAPLPIPNSTPAANRDSTFVKTMVRTIRLTLLGRTNERDPSLFRTDAATITDGYNRGFYRVRENATVGLRNAAYASTR